MRSKLNVTNHQMVFALGEVEQFAANAITYLLVGEDIRVLVDNMVAAQARLNVVNRIILSLSALYSDAESSLEASQDKDAGEREPRSNSDTDRLLDELDGDIDRLQEGGETDEAVKEEREGIANVRKSLLASASSPLALNDTMGDIGQKLARWRQEAAELKETISQNEVRTRSALQAKNLLIEDSKKKSKLAALKEIIAKIQNGPGDSAAARRIADPFTSLMLRSIHSRVDLSKNLRTEVEELRVEFNEAKAGIWEAYQMDIDEEDESQTEGVIRALDDVSFSVMQGEAFGVIGRNGSGKSTLLKILANITEPTSGRAVLGGRVSSLLEVGMGFHPELTGRENVYLNGAILGMTRTEIAL